ncbi:MAG: hypothetical protein DLM57_12665 [Pseudonocardiales bacterium]|nr:MAG: hypothetical protein DLM57_12665 [Pseudonocardiales bacterium]
MRKQILAVLVAGEIGSAVLAWRDLARRPDSAVRGSKRVWRVAMLANPGNSLAYWLLGRH